MSTIDLDALIQKVRDVAAESPDFIYERDASGGCQYQRRGAPSCIMGQALYLLGIPVSDLETFDDRYGPISKVLALGLGINTNDDRVWWLRTVQTNQDSGLAWAKAVEEADHDHQRAQAVANG